MRSTLWQKIGHILRAILAWCLAYFFLGFVRFYGMASPEYATQAIWSSAPRLFISQILLAGIITGVLYGLVDLFTDRIQFQRWSFWRLIALRLILHFFIITFAVLVMSRVRFDILTADHIQQQDLSNVLTNKSFQVFVVFFLIVTVVLNAYQQVNQKFGRGVLLEMMFGKFHKPKEKMRIFMFIDLKSSVRIAEELGHVQYSQLLQDCYFDLNTQLSRYRARVYQYVGDQVVLHWRPEDGLLDNNCIRCFFAFLDRLNAREEHYMQHYGVKPFFKAAAHIGRVTIAEVGVLKRSIAFHGDTVNTTSRLHDQCNNYNQQLLISKELLSRLPYKNELKIAYIGDEVLKGKYRSMEIYGIQYIDRTSVTSDGNFAQV